MIPPRESELEFLFISQFKHHYDIVFRNCSVRRFVQIPLLSIAVELKCTNVQREPKMLIGGLCHASTDVVICG